MSRFVRLPRRDQILLVEAAVLLAGIRLGLRVLTFASVRKLLGTLARTRSPERAGHETVERTLWAVEAAGRQFPRIGTCLTQALAAHVLLGQQGCKANLRIGVSRRDGEFLAHAWLEKDGVILIGAYQRQRFTPMPTLDGLDR